MSDMKKVVFWYCERCGNIIHYNGDDDEVMYCSCDTNSDWEQVMVYAVVAIVVIFAVTIVIQMIGG